VIVIIDNNDN